MNKSPFVNINQVLIVIFEQMIKDRIGNVWRETAKATNPAPKSLKGDLKSATEEMLMAAVLGEEYGE